MTSALLFDLARVFQRESDAIYRDYDWPPPPPISQDERREAERLRITGSSIAYRASVAAYEGR